MIKKWKDQFVPKAERERRQRRMKASTLLESAKPEALWKFLKDTLVGRRTGFPERDRWEELAEDPEEEMNFIGQNDMEAREIRRGADFFMLSENG